MGPIKARMLPLFLLLLLLLLLALVVNIHAYCQCGYRSLIDTTLTVEGFKASIVEYSGTAHVDTDTGPPRVDLAEATSYVWTDLLETDFLHLDDIARDTDWQLQNYSVTAKAARGPFGMRFVADNIKLNRIDNPMNWTGPGELGGDPGLQLSVGAGVTPDGFTRCAQLNTARQDMLWGSYRALLKLPSVPGTCSAFFWYFNDSQEIDMELLSSQFNRNNSTFLINLVHQSPQSAAQGFSVVGKDYSIAPLPFDPTSGFHEYRIDYLPEKIFFYGDGQVIGVMNSTKSPQPGHLILTQWSNGDAGWSAGPPLEPAVLSVAYVKAYFNSSSPVRQADALRRCTDLSQPGAICDIENYRTPINITNPAVGDFPTPALNSAFFYNRPNMTTNQTVYGSNGNAQYLDEIWLRNFTVILVAVTNIFGIFVHIFAAYVKHLEDRYQAPAQQGPVQQEDAEEQDAEEKDAEEEDAEEEDAEEKSAEEANLRPTNQQSTPRR